MSDVWLVMKRGLYYRPNDCGYTGIRDHAGHYTLDEAKDRARGEGITIVRMDRAPEFTTACYDALARDHLTKQRDALRTALTLIRDTFKRDMDQGYKTKDKEFAVDIANLALDTANQQREAAKP